MVIVSRLLHRSLIQLRATHHTADSVPPLDINLHSARPGVRAVQSTSRGKIMYQVRGYNVHSNSLCSIMPLVMSLWVLCGVGTKRVVPVAGVFKVKYSVVWTAGLNALEVL